MPIRNQTFSLEWDLHEKNSAEIFQSVWENKEFMDVTIACDDDQIDAHKIILSSSSSVFHNILIRNPHTHPLIYLKGTLKKDIQSLLQFIYSGQTQVPQEDVEAFMVLASSLKIKGLVEENLTKMGSHDKPSRSKNIQTKHFEGIFKIISRILY